MECTSPCMPVLKLNFELLRPVSHPHVTLCIPCYGSRALGFSKNIAGCAAGIITRMHLLVWSGPIIGLERIFKQMRPFCPAKQHDRTHLSPSCLQGTPKWAARSRRPMICGKSSFVVERERERAIIFLQKWAGYISPVFLTTYGPWWRRVFRCGIIFSFWYHDVRSMLLHLPRSVLGLECSTTCVWSFSPAVLLRCSCTQNEQVMNGFIEFFIMPLRSSPCGAVPTEPILLTVMRHKLSVASVTPTLNFILSLYF
jgi:hypothetical protein